MDSRRHAAAESRRYFRRGPLSSRAAVVVLLVALVGFAAVAVGVGVDGHLGLDQPLVRAVDRHSSAAVHSAMSAVTRLGSGLVLGPLLAVLCLGLALFRRYPAVIFVAAAAIGAEALNVATKAAFERTRPPGATAHGYAFPSGHTMNATAAAAAVVLLLWPTRWRWPALVLGVLVALAVGVSRVWLGAHYPSDVLGGWALSIAWVSLLYLGWRRLSVRPR